VQRLGCKRGRWQKKKNKKMRKHTSLVAYHFLPDPPNVMLDMLSRRVPEVAMRKGGWQWQMRKCERWCNSEVTMKKTLMKLMKVAVSINDKGHNLKVIHHFRK